jgi:hypothetical protein
MMSDRCCGLPPQTGFGMVWPKHRASGENDLVGWMAQARIKKVEAAQKDGSSALLDDVEALVIRPDLEEEFSKYLEARTNFVVSPRSVKRDILEWISGITDGGEKGRRISLVTELPNLILSINEGLSKWVLDGCLGISL